MLSPTKGKTIYPSESEREREGRERERERDESEEWRPILGRGGET